MEELEGTDPRRIGPYEIVGVLGSGGMGRVFLGRTATGVTAAVKVIHADLARDPEFRRRFRREVETTAAVTAPRIAAVLDSDVDARYPWLATEYVAGPSLATAVTDTGPLAPKPALEMAAGVAEALAAIHAQGLVHRDVKPSNVLLAPDGPRLIDFGIARGAADSRLTRTGVALGTPQFMAPEQIQGVDEVGAAADVFALAGVLLYALSGEYPFGEGSAVTLLYRIVHESPRLDRADPDLRPLLAACLDKDPEVRPSAAYVAQRLARLADPERTVEVATGGGRRQADDDTQLLSAVGAQDRRRDSADAATDRLVPISAQSTQSIARTAPFGGPADPFATPVAFSSKPKDRRRPIAIGAGVVTGVAALIVAISLASGAGGSQTGGAGKVANDIPNQLSSSVSAGAGVILPNGSTTTPTGSQSSGASGQPSSGVANAAGSPPNGSAPGATGPNGVTGPAGSTSKPGAPASGSSGASASQPKASGSAPASPGTTAPPAGSTTPSKPATSSSAASDPPPARVSSDSGTRILQSAYDSHCVTASGSQYVAGSCSGTQAEWKVWRGTPTASGYLTWQFESAANPGYCMGAASASAGRLVSCSAGDAGQWWASSRQPDGRVMIETWDDFHYCLLNQGGTIVRAGCSSVGTSNPNEYYWWTLS